MRLPDRPTREPGLAHLLRRVAWSFGYAGAGVAGLFRTTRNARLQLLTGVVAVIFGAWLGLTRIEWAILALTIAGVLALEAMNTAVESAVDLASPELHPLAKRAKDAAAGAVLLMSAGAAVVGAILFLPRLWHRFFS